MKNPFNINIFILRCVLAPGQCQGSRKNSKKYNCYLAQKNTIINNLFNFINKLKYQRAYRCCNEGINEYSSFILFFFTFILIALLFFVRGKWTN